MNRRIFLLDLENETMADEYDACHRPGEVPIQVLADIRAAGVCIMEIYRFADRLVMLTESTVGGEDSDRFSSKASREWEERMDQFQQPLARSSSRAKWQDAGKIFDLSEHDTPKHRIKDMSL